MSETKSSTALVQSAQVGKTDPTDAAQAITDLVFPKQPSADQASRLQFLQAATFDFIAAITGMADPSPERSTAISRAREAKMWASAAVVLGAEKL